MRHDHADHARRLAEEGARAGGAHDGLDLPQGCRDRLPVRHAPQLLQQRCVRLCERALQGAGSAAREGRSRRWDCCLRGHVHDKAQRGRGIALTPVPSALSRFNSARWLSVRKYAVSGGRWLKHCRAAA